ncbi:AAA family ATPase [Naasia sp. SYSU D00948]|uniref:AAA family ATPase n=1 Tax=Naasia sp. SYSU D00948 TaxID=2817379 RepID=UPI001B30BD04|nr:AAA family ATPase [Naasia sp. SYSU D00948]
MLGPGDPLPVRPRRVLVAGVTGVGKTTLAGRIGAVIGSPHTEIDALYHGPGWTYRESFLDEVDELTRRPKWVTEWQYRSARATLASRADTLVWLDLPVRVSLPRLVRRTVRRRLRREELWNGNQEAPLWHFFTGRDHIIRWALRTQRKYKHIVPALEAEHPSLVIVRLRRRRDVERWLTGPLADAVRGD